MNEYRLVEELNNIYYKSHNKKIDKFIKENENNLSDLKALMEYAASKCKSSVTFIYKRDGCSAYSDFIIKPELARFVLNEAKLIMEVTGLKVEIRAYGNAFIKISFKELAEDE